MKFLIRVCLHIANFSRFFLSPIFTFFSFFRVILSGSTFLGSQDFGGFLYFRHTFQCLDGLDLPQSPFLFGVLITRWEMPWARVFPLRLLLRLGAESRYYPTPLWSWRDRTSVYKEIGQTIMQVLCDFRNFTYSVIFVIFCNLFFFVFICNFFVLLL